MLRDAELRQGGAARLATRGGVSVRALAAWLIALALGAGALLPRTAGLADFYTIDEAYHWPLRVRLFSNALHARNWAGTNLTGHPGVTTMWLGSLGRWLAGRAGVYEPSYGDGATYLSYLRLPVAVANSLAVAVCFLLLLRLVRRETALLAALLVATSPFLIAHSRLLHLDALLTSLMTLSLLFLLVALADQEPEVVDAGATRRGLIRPGSPVAPLLASGVCGGLALLTKAPALMLPPLAGLLMLFGPVRGLGPRLRWALPRYLVWLACAALVVFALWPAMWVAPFQAVARVLREVIANGGRPHDGGNFFLGRAVPDPGWLFYPAVVLWRATPVTLFGLVLLPLALRERSRERRALLALTAFVLAFGLGMSAGAKKLDRYLLPIWPSLEVLAAAGIVAVGRRLGDLLVRRAHASRGTLTRFLGALGITALMLPIILGDLWYHPYYLAYFNPLLGGGAAAERVMTVGLGEGLEQVGAWLSSRPDIGTSPVLSWMPPALEHFVPGQVLNLAPPYIYQPSSYAVLYERSIQHQENPVAEAYARQTPALYTLRRFGIDYASVHQLPRPFTHPVDAVFGDGLHFRGFGEQWLGSTLAITPSWDIQRSQAGGVFFFVHVLDAHGTRLAQADLPIDDGMFGAWQAGQQFGRQVPLPLRADLPAGQYRVVMGVYNPSTGQRLPTKGGAPLPGQVDGPDVLLLTTVTRR